jgi:hypothetical protein
MKHLQLTLEQARALSGQSAELDTLIRETWTEDELRGEPWRVKRYEDLDITDGYYIDERGGVSNINTLWPEERDIPTYHTEQQGRSFGVIYPMLSQLMARYNEGWTPDWADGEEEKYVITSHNRELSVQTRASIQGPLAFKFRDRANAFLEDHREFVEEFYKGM